MSVLRASSRLLSKLETAIAQLAAIALFAIMLVVVGDVVMRYVFSNPLIFSYDLISMYLVVVAFFFALPDTPHRHGHVAIDVFQPRLPARLRFAAESVAYAGCTLVMALIAWKLSERSFVAFTQGEVTATTVPWPVWLSYLPAAIGCWLFALRTLYRSAAHLASAIAGRALVELPPPPLASPTQDSAS